MEIENTKKPIQTIPSQGGVYHKKRALIMLNRNKFLSVLLVTVTLAAVVQSGAVSAASLSEWSTDVGSITRARTPSGRWFLGAFSNQTVRLTIQELPPHSTVTLSFDLFLIQSWDGDASPACPSCGPDVFTLALNGGIPLINNTFANYTPEGWTQSYPIPNSAAGAGASERNTLGYFSWYGNYSDTVYHFEKTVANSDSIVEFAFTGSGLQDIGDESWGIDNVAIRTDGHAIYENNFELLTLKVNPKVTINKVNGAITAATISGTVLCEQDTIGSLNGVLRQPVGRKFIVTGTFNQPMSCTPPSAPWSATVTGENGQFAGGAATVSGSVGGCGPIGCDEDAVNTVPVQLKGN